MVRTALLLLVFILISSSSFSQSLNYKKADTTVIAGNHYKVGLLKKIFLGTHYRKEWETKVVVPIFNIDTVAGGLKPVKQGGSRQTTNLRLTDSLGREYVLRSVEKTPSRVLPKGLQNTIAADVIEDQTSAEHPYAQLVIPELADAAGIYHANPRLFYIPYDTGFGEYAKTFAGMLAYLEERPNEDMTHLKSMGNAKNVVGTEKMFENLYEDPDNKIDERFFAKTRLFDMFIGDWGRHEDQWRWAVFDQEKGKLYRPIPRDRDHAFFKFDGIIPFFASRKRTFRQFSNFDYKYKNLSGLNRSATSLDRAVATSITRKEWIQVAKELQNSLTDAVIQDAFKNMPDDIFALHGNEIIAKLKARRVLLPKIAEKYYKELSKNVDVVGSEKNEYFIVNRLDDASTEVLMLKRENKSDTLYRRIFYRGETKEIRLVGREGADEFHVYGKTGKGPKVRMIGGEGGDIFVDSSIVRGICKKNFVYDTKTENFFNLGKESKNLSSDRVADSSNRYKRNTIDYNFTALAPTLEYNPDDGLFFGIGILRKTFGFRKDPYASLQRIRLNYATQTSALSFRYFGIFRQVAGNWHMNLDVRAFGPRYALNYFGFGNNSVQLDTSITYYRVRGTRLSFDPRFYRTVSRNLEVGFGPQYEYTNIESTPGRFIAEQQTPFESQSFQSNNYVGALVFLRYSMTDNVINPKNGIRWFAESGAFNRLENSQPYANFNSNLSLYYTPKLPFRVTFATRVGGATNVGDFQFFRANTLGGTTNLRGYRRTRFYGRSSFYHNTELRFKILDANFYLFPGRIGLIAFYDYGRVWADNEKSTLMHTGYGPGIWIQVYDRAVLSATYGIAETTSFINFQLGFLF